MQVKSVSGNLTLIISNDKNNGSEHQTSINSELVVPIQIRFGDFELIGL
jgi:hypothetical protein